MVPGLGRSPGEGKDYLLQCSGLGNSMDCRVHGIANSLIRLRGFHFHIGFKRLKLSSSYWTLLPALKNKPLLFYFLFFGHVISVPRPGIKHTPSAPLHWEHGVSPTGLPGRSSVVLCLIILSKYLLCRSTKWTWPPMDTISVIQFSHSVV